MAYAGDQRNIRTDMKKVVYRLDGYATFFIRYKKCKGKADDDGEYLFFTDNIQ